MKLPTGLAFVIALGVLSGAPSTTAEAVRSVSTPPLSTTATSAGFSQHVWAQTNPVRVYDDPGDSGRRFTDIRWVRFANRQHQLVARVKLARFQHQIFGVSFAIDVGKRGGRGYSARAISKLSPRLQPRPGWFKALSRFRDVSKPRTRSLVHCRGFTVRGFPATDIVAITVPQRCLGRATEAAWLQVRTDQPFEGWWSDLYLDKIDAGYTRVTRA